MVATLDQWIVITKGVVLEHIYNDTKGNYVVLVARVVSPACGTNLTEAMKEELNLSKE